MSAVWPYLAALIPVVGMAWLFWLVMKNLVEADRTERRAHAQWERESEKRDGEAQNAPPVAEKDAEKHRDAPHNSR